MVMAQADQDFLRALGRALLALASAALALLLLVMAYYSVQVPEGANTSHSKTIAGKELSTVMGTTVISGNALEVTELKNHDDKQHVLATVRTTLRADNYPFLSYQIRGWHTGMRINFIWRTAENPRGLSTVPLNRNLAGTSTFNLAGQDNWNGKITEVGLHLVGELRDVPLEISELKLEPHGWQNTVAAIWSEWTAFRGWRGTSINFLQGTPGPAGSATLSPTLATALWCGLSLLLLYVFGAIRRSHKLISYGTTILVPWIALDLLWQNELSTQLKETRHLFSGKSMHEKHQADRDSHIYSYAKRLKEEVLPDAVSRIFILHDSEGHNYDRLKVQYYLLPHNIYNYGRIPPGKAVEPGDFVLLLGDTPDLTYRKDRGQLVWGKHKSLKVVPVDSDRRGQLYKVVPAAAAATAPGG